VIRLAVRCRPEDAERVLAELLELAPGGVEEVGLVADPEAPGRTRASSGHRSPSAPWEEASGRYEFAIYGPPGEVPALPELRAAAGGGLVEVSATEIPDDWADRWRDFHEPASIAGGRIVVRPSWRNPQPASDPAGADAGAARKGPSRGRGQGIRAGAEQLAGIDVVVDPGQAFGTGAHATTRMCLELLLELADAGEASGPLVDLGTGSGVLAIAAAKLGFAPVSGCDSEPAALEAAASNAAANGVALELRRLNLREEAPPLAPVLVANLTAPLLTGIASRLPVPPRRMVCSGLLSSEVGAVRAALRAGGLEVVGRRSRGEWVALLCDGGDSDGRPG
jgi:ribosomal protein L11 methyltransferase